ncbi:hypothetical protein K491DRAFT_726537 [Lophiostoma macrostomum CBS 122681]|uniref:PLC-like phosphodiesterase n=1 Tax=Lophiostoma macrostomum CBS 122681 TaxID=1314788 RepID=A0A6A6SXX3_9PLEO|nr:hypothetical protein K491DRAFT_726537 [Lophiostoma macrostomum CBS 122681]
MQNILVLLILVELCIGGTDAARACNNYAGLCEKPYDTITYLGAHDSPFLNDASTGHSSFGNQFIKTTTQLDAGVRLLSAQVHIGKNDETGKRELHICHTSCALLDAGTLRDWLQEVRMWMDANPNDVVTVLLVNSDGVDARELEGVYSEADLAHYGYIPPDPDRAPPLSNDTNPTWPTLDEMINRNERLVSFINPLKTDKENAPYLLNEFTFLWENYYQVTSQDNFTCAPDRPADQTVLGMHNSGRLFLMNHFLYEQQAFGIQVPAIANISTTNSFHRKGALSDHLLDCSNDITRQPSFVLVDFFHVGPAITTVDIFNGVRALVGRFSRARSGHRRFWGPLLLRLQLSMCSCISEKERA